MGKRIGRIGRIQTDFFLFFHGFQAHAPTKKSVSIRPIRSIRSPIVSQPFLSCTDNMSNKMRKLQPFSN
jgi:hypothetical protein